MRDRTACFTGHRSLSLWRRRSIARQLEAAIVAAIGEGYRYFGTGGALGFDTLAAQTVLRLRERYPDIRLILVLPCPSQTAKWREKDAAEYERIRAAADKVVVLSPRYTPECMHRRNRHLVDSSSLCIAYLTESDGGTASTVRYARSRGLRLVNIAEG